MHKLRGVTIVEMLVALVVLSIGMLGIAGLFAVTLRSSGSAIQRVQAVGLASDIADRIRANRRAGNAYSLDPVSADDKCIGESSVTCGPDEMAKNDVWQWRHEIAQALGANATGTVEYSASPAPSAYTIRINWKGQGRSSGEPDGAEEYVLRIVAPGS